MVVGDFNCYIGQSGVRKSTGTFGDCITEMESHGLRSLYHEQTGENFGTESTPTFYWQFNPDDASYNLSAVTYIIQSLTHIEVKLMIA